jgi:tetratricopeptide (TPR) repeat protein
MKKQEYRKAAEMFEKKIGCDSSTVGGYLNAGSCYMAIAGSGIERSAMLSRARELLTVAHRNNPENLTIHFRLAQYFALVDSVDLAKEEYEAVLKKASEDPKLYRKEAAESHGQIAMYYSYKKQPERALASYQKAQSLGYENSTMQLNWGIAFLQIVDPQKPEKENRTTTESALGHFRRAVALDPKNAQAHFWLGEGLIRLRIPGNNASVRSLTAEACKEFKVVLQLNPGHEDARKEMERYGCK